MKIYYVIDPKGEYCSHKGGKFFKRLAGAELFAFLQTPQAQSKKYYTYREGMDEVYIEVENGRGDRSERRHEAYLYQVKKRDWAGYFHRANGRCRRARNLLLAGLTIRRKHGGRDATKATL